MAGLGEEAGGVAISDRGVARAEVVVRVVRLVLEMELDDRPGDEIGGDDIEAPARVEGEYRQWANRRRRAPCRTGSSREARIPRRCSAEDRVRHVGEELGHQVLAELLGPGVGVVVATGEVDHLRLGDQLILAPAGHRHGGDVAEPAEAVEVARGLGELEHLEGAAEMTLKQEVADLRLSEAAQWITESISPISCRRRAWSRPRAGWVRSPR